MEQITWKYETRSVHELSKRADNPRRLSKSRAKQLSESISEFGCCEPIVIQPDGKIIGGHQRFATLKTRGDKHVDVSVPSRALSEDEEKRLNICLNKITGEFDFDILANQWDPELLLQCGFNAEELYSDIEPQEKPKKLSINIKVETQEDLKNIEQALDTLLMDYPSAQMKVRGLC